MSLLDLAGGGGGGEWGSVGYCLVNDCTISQAVQQFWF